MSEHPILFSGAMVRAILDGKKTQTRRVMNPQPDFDRGVWSIAATASRLGFAANTEAGFAEGILRSAVRCPYGAVGDTLWVRETWGYAVASLDEERLAVYRATIEDPPRWPSHRPPYEEMVVWRPSIHMPRWASRISLRITDVRVERLQECSEEDAIAEGLARSYTQEQCDTIVGLIGSRAEDHGWKNYLWHGDVGRGITQAQADAWPYQFSNYKSARDSYASLWESINGKRAPWSSNPWLWVVSFERIGATP